MIKSYTEWVNEGNSLSILIDKNKGYYLSKYFKKFQDVDYINSLKKGKKDILEKALKDNNQYAISELFSILSGELYSEQNEDHKASDYIKDVKNYLEDNDKLPLIVISKGVNGESSLELNDNNEFISDEDKKEVDKLLKDAISKIKNF